MRRVEVHRAARSGQADLDDVRLAADSGQEESRRFAGVGGTGIYRNADGDADRYDDIINLPHHVSKIHPQMPVSERAAQFAPFAALSGHGDAIKEMERQVEERMKHEYD